MASFTERIQELQKTSGALKKDIAASAGLSIMGYYRYEQGERQPTLPVLIALADYFNVSLDYLVGRTDNPDVNQ